MQTSSPAPTTDRPSTVIDSIRFTLPAAGITHLSEPVSIVRSLPFFVTLTEPETAERPEDKVKEFDSPAGTTVANPIHLSEPSGQYASGQDCKGNCCPFDVKAKVSLRWTEPCGQGTPKLTPESSSSGFPSCN